MWYLSFPDLLHLVSKSLGPSMLLQMTLLLFYRWALFHCVCVCVCVCVYIYINIYKNIYTQIYIYKVYIYIYRRRQWHPTPVLLPIHTHTPTPHTHYILFIHLSADGHWVASMSYLLWAVLLWTLRYMYLLELEFSSFPDILTGVELLDHLVTLILVF